MSEKLSNRTDNTEYLDPKYDDISQDIADRISSNDEQQKKMDDFRKKINFSKENTEDLARMAADDRARMAADDRARMAADGRARMATTDRINNKTITSSQTVNISESVDRIKGVRGEHAQFTGRQELINKAPVENESDLSSPIMDIPPVQPETVSQIPPREINLIWQSPANPRKHPTENLESTTSWPEEEVEKPTKLQITQEERKANEDEIAALKREKARRKKLAETQLNAETQPDETQPDEVQPDEEPELNDGTRPLAAIGIDWGKGRERLARKFARKDLKAELENGSLINYIWKGKLFRNHYIKKYTNEYLEGKRTDQEDRTIANIINRQKQDIMDELMFNAVNKMSSTENGEKLVKVDEKTNTEIKNTIELYAKLRLKLNETISNIGKDLEPQEDLSHRLDKRREKLTRELDQEFKEDLARVIDLATEEGRIEENIEAGNYLAVAKEVARRYEEIAKNIEDKAEQEEAMARVMVGFQAYDVKVERSLSPNHKNSIDKIVDAMSHKHKKISLDVFAEAVSEVTQEEINSGEKEASDYEKVDKLLTDNKIYSDKTRKEWEAAWNNFSDAEKEYALKILDEHLTNPNQTNKYGNGIMVWLAINGRR